MKKLLSVILAIAMVAGGTVFAFEDIKGNAYEKEIVELNNWGYVDGYEDGTFKPEESLTRAEAAQMMRMAMYPLEPFADMAYQEWFSDVDSYHWAWEPLQILAAHRVIDGFPDGTFRPEENVTVAQAFNMCLKMTGYTQYIEKDTAPWYDGVVKAAVQYGFTKDLDFEPEKDITRGQMAKLIHNTVNTPLVIVISWTTNVITQEPIAETEIADGKAGRELMTLIRNYNTNLKCDEVMQLIGKNKADVCSILQIDPEADLKLLEQEWDGEKFEVLKIWRYNGRPVNVLLNFWADHLMMISYRFPENPDSAYEFANEANAYFTDKFGSKTTENTLEGLTLAEFLSEKNKDYSTVWSDVDESLLENEAWSKAAETMDKKTEFAVRVSNLVTGTDETEMGMVQIGVEFTNK